MTEVRPAGAAAREPEARYDAVPDYIGMACISAGVSLREALTPDELVKALLTGKPPRERRAHFACCAGWSGKWAAGPRPSRSPRT